YVPLHVHRDFADKMKIRILKWERCAGLFWWIHRGLKSGERRERYVTMEIKSEGCNVRTQPTLAGFKGNDKMVIMVQLCHYPMSLILKCHTNSYFCIYNMECAPSLSN
ncbi:hypothetical protein H1C71_004769, partial [Ictidomys tridecemlineatus]